MEGNFYAKMAFVKNVCLKNNQMIELTIQNDFPSSKQLVYTILAFIEKWCKNLLSSPEHVARCPVTGPQKSIQEIKNP